MNKIMSNISFTKDEIKIIIFIILVLIAGLSVKFYKHIFTVNSASPYDFTKSDSIFKSRSYLANKENKTQLNDSLFFFSEDLININTAGIDDLSELPGIGESTAQKILDYREKKNGFKSIEELMNVGGIGRKKFDKLKNFIKTK